MQRTSRFPLRRLCPVLETPGFVVSEPLAGTPFRRRRLDIENFVSPVGVVGVRNFPATDILPESPKGRVLRWHARKRKRGPLSETPFPFDKSRLTLAGSNHPDDAENGDKDANPRPIDVPA